MINEAGDEHRLVRSFDGRIEREHTFDGREVRYRYDALGRLERRDVAGATTHFAYDPLGRLLERHHPDGTLDRFTYDALGRLERAEQGEVVCTYAYDDRGNVTHERTERRGRVAAFVFTHDALGDVTRVEGPDGVCEVRRDAMGRPLEVAYGDQAPLVFAYDEAGNEVARRLPGGGLLRHEVDPNGDVVRETLDAPSPTALLRWPLPDATAAPPAAPTSPASLAVLWQRANAWSPGGELVGWRDLGGTHALARDVNGRVVGHARDGRLREVYAFTPTGDRLEPALPCRYGPGGRLVARGDVRYEYDAQGRLVTKREGRGEAERVWRYGWNGAGLLATVETPDGLALAFAYDVFARRIDKHVWRAGRLEREVHYAWRGDALVYEERREHGAGGVRRVVRTYPTVPGARVPFAQREVVDGEAGPFDPHDAPEVCVR